MNDICSKTTRLISPPLPANDLAGIQALLSAQDYERAAHRLEALHKEAKQNGANVLAEVLAAALEITAVCQASQAQQAAWENALRASVLHEQQLRAQLQRLLQTMLAAQDPLTPERLLLPAPPAGDSPVWRERLRHWLIRIRGEETDVAEYPAPVAISSSPQDEFWPTTHHPLLSVYLLGAFRVYLNDLLIEKWSGVKSRLVFKYLVLNKGQPVHQEVLMEHLWPQADPDSARRSLYQAVYLLRQALQTAVSDTPLILTEDSAYQLHPDVAVWVDKDAFSAALLAGRKLEEQGAMALAVRQYEAAENLYEGDLLPEDPYEEWLLVAREDLKLAYLDILDRLSRQYMQEQRFGLCVSYCRKILQHDNCREDIHRRLMRVYVQQGQRHLAVQQFHRCEQTLRQELAIDPMPATREIYQELLNH